MNISPPLFCGLSHSRPISAQDPTKISTLPASDTLPTCAQVERPTTRDPSPQPLTTTIPNHQPPEPLFPPSSHSTSAPPPPNPTSSHPTSSLSTISRSKKLQKHQSPFVQRLTAVVSRVLLLSLLRRYSSHDLARLWFGVSGFTFPA